METIIIMDLDSFIKKPGSRATAYNPKGYLEHSPDAGQPSQIPA